MAAQGFEYVPTAYAEPEWYLESPVGTSESEMPRTGSIEYAEQYGYAVTEGYEDDRNVTHPVELDPDNQETRRSLSPQEQLAFDGTLYGPGVLWSDEEWDEYFRNTNEFGNWSGSGTDPFAQGDGCLDKAITAHPEPQPNTRLYEDPDYQVLQETLYEKLATAANDSKYLDIQLEWSQCMSEAGYHFTYQHEPVQAIQDKYSALGGFYDEQVAQVPYDEPDYEEQLEAIFAQPLPGIEELREEEFATAIADARCVEEVNFLSREQALTIEVENEFYQDYRQVITDLVEHYRN